MRRIPKDLLARLDHFHDEVEGLFQRLFGQELGAGFDHDEALPAIDLVETEDEIVFRADLPGVDRDGIELHAAPNFIVIKGEKKAEKVRHDCLRVERSFGAFQRLVPLPATVDTAKVEAAMADGVLEVRVRKMVDRRKTQRKIEIT